MTNEQNKETRKEEDQRGRERERKPGMGEREEMSLRANEVTPDHLGKEGTIHGLLELEGTLEIICYLHSLPSLLYKYIKREGGN